MVLKFSHVAENLPRTASESNREHHPKMYNFPNIAVSEFYFRHTVTPEPNKREIPNLKHTVSWPYTIKQGSCPLPVMYVFLTNVSK